MESEPKLPGKFSLTASSVLNKVGNLAILLGLGAMTQPDYAATLGLPAGLLGILGTIASKELGDWNRRKTAECHTAAEIELETAKLAPAQVPDGVDPIAHGLAELVAVASSKRLKELVTDLNKAIETHTKRTDGQ